MDLVESVLLGLAWLCHLAELSRQFPKVGDKATDTKEHDEEYEQQFERICLRNITIAYCSRSYSWPIQCTDKLLNDTCVNQVSVSCPSSWGIEVEVGSCLQEATTYVHDKEEPKQVNDDCLDLDR